MQKVDQALGRVVRRMEDRGSALLIDPRYHQAQYRDLLPPWWDYQHWLRLVSVAWHATVYLFGRYCP